MIKRLFVLLGFLVVSGAVIETTAQVDSVVGQITSASTSSFGGGISADGRLIVFESTGNFASVNPRNEDGNNEIFIFDYAQRRIFQITDTKSVLNDVEEPFIASNTRVSILNSRPVLSADGRWIAFGSNATTSVSGSAPDGTNPGSFDGNSFTDSKGDNPLTLDGNMEMWIYHVPAVAPASLSTGDELPVTDLSTGTFTQVTNTPAFFPPVPGSTTQSPIISTDNRVPSISDDGQLTAFISNRNLVGTGNAEPEDNPEIFVYSQSGGSKLGASGTISQITETPRGTIGNPISNGFPSIAGNGSRVVFTSNGDNPIVGMTGGTNTDGNREVYYSDLSATGAPTGAKKQITDTEAATAGATVNLYGFGRKISRDGNLIVFDSYADLANENSGDNFDSFGTYLYDATTEEYRSILSRSDADENAAGGDIERTSTFSDYVAGVPQSIVMQTRMNIVADGTIAENEEDGLNPDATRQSQVYSFPIQEAPETAIFTRISKLPAPPFALATLQLLPSDSSKRVAINLPGAEIGSGNPDLSSEVYYLLQPTAIRESSATFRYSTGATKIPIQNDPVATPTPTPTPSIAAKSSNRTSGKINLGPTPTPTPTPTPPSTPSAKQGLAPGMLAFLDFSVGMTQPTVARTAVGSIDRSFPLPIELSGVTMTVGGAAVGLKRVSQRQIEFVVPKGLGADLAAPYYPVVINNNGTIYRGEMAITEQQPDIFRTDQNPELNRAKILNVTNRIRTTEPFSVRTFKLRGSKLVPSVLRVFATGVRNFAGQQSTIRIGSINTGGQISNAFEVEPGVYFIDFELSDNMAGIGDGPVVISTVVGTGVATSRLDADAPRTRIL
ncbi:MAG: hypothetical protein R2684_01775 [Pyrinomonadaceae bacterium]